MQVFVNKSALALTDPIMVVGSYLETPTLSRTLHGSGATVFSLPASALVRQTGQAESEPPIVLLKASWRSDNMVQIVRAEAARRINEAFPDYMQRNSNNDVNASITLYGTDATLWPQDAKDRKAEGDRGWTYIDSVRQTSDALETQTTLTDPTDNSHWPTVIPPVYIPPA